MPSIDELLKKYGGELGSILPLLLLFAFWWIFSMLGSKIKKTGEKGEETGSPGLQERILQAMTGDQAGDQTSGRKVPTEVGAYDMDREEQPSAFYQETKTYGGQVNVRPISPKWWGA
jgi:hypothetical protein